MTERPSPFLADTQNFWRHLFSFCGGVISSKRVWILLNLKQLCKKKLSNLGLSLFLNMWTKYGNTDSICVCKQKTLFPVSSTNSSQTDQALPVKASKSNFVTFFVYFGNGFDHFWNLFVCFGGKPETILLVTCASLASLARRSWRWISE